MSGILVTTSRPARVRAFLPGLLIAALLSVGCVGQGMPTGADAPPRLQPGAGETLASIARAIGVQIYECRARTGATAQHEWAFVAPEADLFDRNGKRIGRHYTGPHWEAADGSKVMGSLREHVDAPSSYALAWLLLSTVSTGHAGTFSKVSSIQRLHTVGGTPPASGCAANTAGTRTRVYYSADYYLFTKQGQP
jgi:hypothetical protein